MVVMMAFTAMALPTYGELIQLLQSAEAEAAECDVSLCNLVTTKFRECFPHICIGHPGRFLDTMERIAAPISLYLLESLMVLLYDPI